MGEKTIHEFYAAGRSKEIRIELFEILEEEKLDILITPGGALPALPLVHS